MSSSRTSLSLRPFVRMNWLLSAFPFPAFVRCPVSSSTALIPPSSHPHSKESQLDVLVNNAGIMRPAPPLTLTPHGVDIQFGTNVLGHFHLTQLLLPTLLSSVKSSTDNHVRIVNVSSNVHWVTPTESSGGPIVYESLVKGPVRDKFSSVTFYGQSKAVRDPSLPVAKPFLNALFNRAMFYIPTRSLGGMAHRGLSRAL